MPLKPGKDQGITSLLRSFALAALPSLPGLPGILHIGFKPGMPGCSLYEAVGCILPGVRGFPGKPG